VTGSTPDELARSPFARFYNPERAQLQPQVAEALLVGPQARRVTQGIQA